MEYGYLSKRGYSDMEIFSSFVVAGCSVLQIRRGKRYNLGIIFQITPLKHMLLPIIGTVLPRQF